MNYTINLYGSNIALRSEKLFMVDDFETYLNSITPLYTQEINFQKVALELNIKLILNEENTWLLKNNAIYYASITSPYTLNRGIYYYVKKISWTSQSCCMLEMVLDTLNTFKIGEDYTFNKRTHITRTHKDRFTISTSYSKEFDLAIAFEDTALGERSVDFETRDHIVINGYYLFSKVNNVDFNIEVPCIILKEGKPVIFFENQLASDEVYIKKYADDLTEISVYREGFPIYEFEIETDSSWDIYLLQDFIYAEGLTERDYWSDFDDYFYFAESLISVGTIRPLSFTRKIDLIGEDINPTLYHQSSKDITLFDSFDEKKEGDYSQVWNILYTKLISESEVFPQPIKFFLIPFAQESGENFIVSFKQGETGVKTTIDKSYILNKSLEGHIKLFEPPYMPLSNMSISHNGIESILTGENNKWGVGEFDDKWGGASSNDKFITSLGSYDNLPTISLLTRKLDIVNFRNPIPEKLILNFNEYSRNQDRDNFLESKLFHSEFFYSKFYYDSFSLSFNYELISLSNNALEEKLNISYSFSTILSSNFMFTFNNYTCGDTSLEDFNNIIVVKRNNEKILYNDSYLTYLRNGFNFDKKNKEQQTGVNWALTGVSLVGTAITTATAVSTGGITIPMAVASAVGTISSLTNAISQQVSSERSLEQKIQQLKAQASSVSGSDDLDMLKTYSHNKLHYTEYECSPTMKNLIADLFYYMGYRENKMGIPDITSRTRFNFLACEPILNITSINMSEEVKMELENIMKTGFTIIHHFNNYWDFQQEKENWEHLIINYIPN